MQSFFGGEMRFWTAKIAVVGFALAFVMMPGPASAASSEPPAEPGAGYTAATAAEQLDDAIAALDGSAPQLEPTIELHELALALPELRGSERAQARRLLARPPSNDGAGEPFGAEWSVPESPDSPACSANFCAHWVETTSDAPSLTDDDLNDVPDYVDQTLARAETSSSVENGSLNWPGPLSDGSRGGDGRVDIYFADLCGLQNCLFGYANTDDPTCAQPPFRCFSYLVLDDDYSFEEFEYLDPDVPLSVTVAHEYNHVLQFGIDAIQDSWMLESVATWAEEKVFPDANDWVNYMPRWSIGPGRPLTSINALHGIKVYGSAIWNHWLDSSTAGFGPSVIRKAWASSRKTSPKHYAVGAYDRAIKRAGGRGFAQSFAGFAAATPEWRTGDTGLPDAADLPDVKRDGRLKPGRRLRFKLLHTGFRLIRVKPGSAGSIRLVVKAPAGVRTGIALVARDGDPLSGDVVRKAKFAAKGRKLGVSLKHAGSYERITAVVTNAEGRVRGYSGNDWKYRADNARFEARLKRS